MELAPAPSAKQLDSRFKKQTAKKPVEAVSAVGKIQVG